MRRSSSSPFIAPHPAYPETRDIEPSCGAAAIPLPLTAEDDRVHDPAGEQREGPGNHQRADKETGHRPAMFLDLMLPGAQDGKRQHDQREHRQ